jgi:hypothetical protein
MCLQDRVAYRQTAAKASLRDFLLAPVGLTPTACCARRRAATDVVLSTRNLVLEIGLDLSRHLPIFHLANAHSRSAIFNKSAISNLQFAIP